METNFLIYLSLGMLASFVGTIPVGPVNISVVATTLNRNVRSGIIFSGSAAIVEILQSFIALQFGVLLSELIFTNDSFKIFVSLVFLAIGLVFLLKKQKAIIEDSAKKKLSPWLSGLVVAMLNPQALPFWIFVLGYYQSEHLIDMHLLQGAQLTCVFSFLLGVSLGKFSALSLYSYLSAYLSEKLKNLSYWMNKILGIVFILLSLSQIIKLF
ncbi:MAG: hypothetical protein CMO01_25285 [Thalassobius sp.]|nr:hypothetical protein [Thalassovita sp.]